MTDRESFRTEISERVHAAEEALVRGDVGPRLLMWSHDDPVSVFAAVGPSKSGWDELEPMFHSVAARLSGGHDVTYEIMSFDVSGDMAWTAGFARFTTTMDGGPPTRFTLRSTNVYRREGGEWKMVHEHTNFEPTDDEQSLPIAERTT